MRTTRLWPLAIALLTATLVTGCGGASTTGDPATALGHVGDGSSAPVSSGAPSAPGGTPSNPAPSTSNSPPPATYPNSAQGYSDAVISAFVNHKSSRLADLSSPDTVNNLGKLDHPDSHWHFVGCAGTAPTYCTYDNNNGDRMKLMIDETILGKPHAIQDASIDVTTYDTAADGYVTNFVQAWSDKNTRRMAALSTSSVASHFAALPPPQSTMLSDKAATPDADHTTVTIYDSIAGQTEYVVVQDGKLGHAHAITGLGSA